MDRQFQFQTNHLEEIPGYTVLLESNTNVIAALIFVHLVATEMLKKALKLAFIGVTDVILQLSMLLFAEMQ